jgi:hypothetical protein
MTLKKTAIMIAAMLLTGGAHAADEKLDSLNKPWDFYKLFNQGIVEATARHVLPVTTCDPDRTCATAWDMIDLVPNAEIVHTIWTYANGVFAESICSRQNNDKAHMWCENSGGRIWTMVWGDNAQWTVEKEQRPQWPAPDMSPPTPVPPPETLVTSRTPPALPEATVDAWKHCDASPGGTCVLR